MSTATSGLAQQAVRDLQRIEASKPTAAKSCDLDTVLIIAGHFTVADRH